MARVPDVRRARDLLGETPNGEHRPAAGELAQERTGRFDLDAGRPPVRVVPGGPVRVRGYDVPAERLLLEPEVTERAADDRGAGLRRAGARELALGGERDAGHA